MSQNVKTTNQKVVATPTYRIFAKDGMFQDYKSCCFCGQNKIPFKKGICPKCCNQVDDIQYVKNPQEYVKSNYGAINIDKIGLLHTEEDLDEK